MASSKFKVFLVVEHRGCRLEPVVPAAEAVRYLRQAFTRSKEPLVD